eukprot:scaffold57350_cov69-Phaeocystis_antarctica.AAC.2
MHGVQASVADRLTLQVLVAAELDLICRHRSVTEGRGQLRLQADARLGPYDDLRHPQATERRSRVRGPPRPLVLDRHLPVSACMWAVSRARPQAGGRWHVRGRRHLCTSSTCAANLTCATRLTRSMVTRQSTSDRVITR